MNSEIDLSEFDCKNKDLSDFLKTDALPFQEKLMGVTYVFTVDKTPEKIACFFTISNDGLRVDTLINRSAKDRVNKTVPRPKHMRVYPAVKIGRLGVHSDLQRRGIGDELMSFIKSWFIDGNNKTGCKFLLVDAYNTPEVLKYYEKNNFLYLLTPEKEAEYYDKTVETLETRIMFFDLTQLI